MIVIAVAIVVLVLCFTLVLALVVAVLVTSMRLRMLLCRLRGGRWRRVVAGRLYLRRHLPRCAKCAVVLCGVRGGVRIGLRRGCLILRVFLRRGGVRRSGVLRRT